MTDFAHVTEDAIDIGPGPLPSQWRAPDGILHTGLRLWPLDELLIKDWRPVVDTPPAIDPITQELGVPVYTVAPTEITGVWPINALDPATIQLNQDEQAAEEIAGRFTFTQHAALVIVLEALRELYLKQRADDPTWDLPPDLKRRGQALFNAVTGP